ncbi:MAG: CCA tRNA nucleotidyltransferase [Candidatus Cyclobacteriaceae bacterium M3_2C_046]
MIFKQVLSENRIFDLIHTAAEELGFPAYVIGGYVRDLILKRPSKDIDVVCVGSGIQLAQKVVDKFDYDAKISIFKNFGTAMVKLNDWEVEFVGARKESYNRNSRKPVVENGSLEDDQKRRDFTINALAIGLNEDDFGQLLDPFEGLRDLKKKMIRTPLDPGITFSDDPLRMMRAIRFATQLQFDIAPDTFEAINQHVERIEIVSAERITDELNKIILSPTPSYGFKLLFHSGLLERIFPEMTALQGVETIDSKSHKDNFYHTLKVLDNVSQVSGDLWLRWAAILHDIAKPVTKRFDPKSGWTFHGHEDRGAKMVPYIFRKLKLPLNDKMKKVQKLVKLHLRPISLVNDNITDTAVRRLIYEAGDNLEDLMALCRADITSKDQSRVRKYLKNFEKVEKKFQEVEQKDRVRNFQPPITGDVIIKTFDIEPSKVIGEIKDGIKEAILEGKISNNYESAFHYMLKLGKEKGLYGKQV